MDNRKNDRELEHTTPELMNPYRPYDLDSGDWFYHEDVIKQIKRIFKSHPKNRVILLLGSLGTGKTSTLKQIEKSRNLLGKNYIPIYLNSKKYSTHEPDDLRFFLYNDIVRALNQYGHRIPKLDVIKGRSKKGYTSDEMVLTIDSNIKKDETLILMFDEFDNLLKNADIENISEHIRYIKHMEREWNHYGLILAGDKSMIHSTPFKAINQFLDTAFKTDLEEMQKEEHIRQLIIDPVKNRLTYNEDAINRILWYSGSNLYFQQLICYYIFDYLQEKNRNLCSKEDVEVVIQRILSDKRDDFINAWENEISTEIKLIASALADEDVMEKRGNVYFLKNSLLDGIFGNVIYKKLQQLHKLGYFNKIQGRFFAETPLKIPLFGRWIQKEHSFLKTVIENIEEISDKIPLDKLIEEIQESPAAKLKPFNKETILEVAEKWFTLKDRIMKTQTNADLVQIEDFLKIFLQRLNLNIKNKASPNPNYFWIDIKDVEIGLLEEALCFIQDKAELTKADILKIERTATAVALDTQTKLTLFFYFQKSQMVEDVVKRTYLNLIAMEENDFKKILLSKSPAETFRNIILSRLSLHRVSPYKTDGPVRATFYGRSYTISGIIGSTDTSFAIVGARRIGKSSLLRRIKDTLPPDTIYLFLDLEVEFLFARNYKNFLIGLEAEIKRVFNKEVKFGGWLTGRRLSKLPEIIQQLPRNGKRIVFIIDEIDDLIGVDRKHKYKMMKIFRTISEKNYCQFIFAGFKELYHIRREIENPMYNFCDEIILNPLDEEAAMDLITKPIENIGVHYKNPEDRELILEYTARHPNLIQFFCKQLMGKVESHDKVEERRTIFKKDIEEIFNTEYEKYIINDIYMFFSDLSDINRLILILLLEKFAKEDCFSANEIRELLVDHGISISLSKVHQNVRNLVLRFILVEEKVDKYRFALPVFPDILRKNVDSAYKKKLIKEIKANV